MHTQHEVRVRFDEDGRHLALCAAQLAAALALLAFLLDRLAPAEDALLLRAVGALGPREEALVDEDEELEDGDEHGGGRAEHDEREWPGQVEQRERLRVGRVEPAGACTCPPLRVLCSHSLPHVSHTEQNCTKQRTPEDEVVEVEQAPADVADDPALPAARAIELRRDDLLRAARTHTLWPRDSWQRMLSDVWSGLRCRHRERET